MRCSHGNLLWYSRDGVRLEIVCCFCQRSTYVYPNEFTEPPMHGLTLVGHVFGAEAEARMRAIDWGREFRRIAFKQIQEIVNGNE